VGDLELLIPKLRAGSFLPSILEPRRRVDQALHAVIMEAYIGGVSTRKVDALVSALGSQSGISKSQVSRRGTPEIPGDQSPGISGDPAFARRSMSRSRLS
jgi:transposase-like protein